jgi:AraC-type DNA-binding domain-containing proteins
MDFNFSFTVRPMPTTPVALRTVYIVNADPSYDVRKSDGQGNDIIALRTIGGKGGVKIEGLDEMTVLPGTLLFFKHNDVRQYYCSDETWSFWWFEFNTMDVLDIPLNKIYKIETVENEAGDCNASLNYLRMNESPSLALASACFNLLLHKWKMNLDSRKDANTHSKAIEKAINYISNNLTQSISIKAIASASGFCERRFRQIFKRATGLQPKKYIDTLRIGMAEELLKNSPLTIAEISERLGYSSQFHFSKAFHEVKGMAPSYFRKL